MRAQLARPDQHLLTPEAYNQLFSMHGITMIFLYASPILSGFSNYLWPLMLGSRDMAFPRLNAFSYWVFLFSGLFLYSSFLVGQAPDGGWFAYAPLTEHAYSPGLQHGLLRARADLPRRSRPPWARSTSSSRCSSCARPGMSINRLPIFVWGTLTTSFSMLFALPALTAACIMLYFDRRFGMHFFDAAAGGHPLLWQHLFWIFGHPWVYIVVLPAMGIVSTMHPDLLPPSAGRLHLRRAGDGGHRHPRLRRVGAPHVRDRPAGACRTDFFSAASMVISIPSAVAVFAWLATIWHGAAGDARRRFCSSPASSCCS